MSRGRKANTVHVVTGPSPRPGQPDLAQAQPEAVLADILDRTESAWTATEAMREAQAFATNTGHLLAMYTAATRPGVYAAIDERLKARLSPAQYARYEAESQRPVFQRQVYAATLAGADLDQVLDTATGQDITGARSIAAVMHGRLKTTRVGETEHQQAVLWAQRVPEVVRPRTARWAWSWLRPSTPRGPGWPGPGRAARALGPQHAGRLPRRRVPRAPGRLARPRRRCGGLPAGGRDHRPEHGRRPRTPSPPGTADLARAGATGAGD